MYLISYVVRNIVKPQITEGSVYENSSPWLQVIGDWVQVTDAMSKWKTVVHFQLFPVISILLEKSAQSQIRNVYYTNDKCRFITLAFNFQIFLAYFCCTVIWGCRTRTRWRSGEQVATGDVTFEGAKLQQILKSKLFNQKAPNDAFYWYWTTTCAL